MDRDYKEDLRQTSLLKQRSADGQLKPRIRYSCGYWHCIGIAYQRSIAVSCTSVDGALKKWLDRKEIYRTTL